MSHDHMLSLSRRATSEGLGTLMLTATVVGSGIMAQRLGAPNVAIVLMANALATGAGLAALILTFGPVSGAHFNPAVTLADASQGGIAWSDVVPYVLAQIVGAIVGTLIAHVMFAEPLVTWSRHTRAGSAQLFSEGVATFGLLAVIWGCSRRRSGATAFAVSAYIVAAYWFTASTSFANPAVTIGRCFTDSFSGIRPVDVPSFVAAQIAGAALATALFRWLVPVLPATADRVVVPQSTSR
jgi:glycerol uptake facilitator-like aquaporin